MPLTSQRTKLDYNQRAKLKVLLREAEARGLPVAEYIREQLRKSSRSWSTDNRGYFPRFDGKLFNPYEAQQSFLNSQARFALFIGGRGCVSPNTLINGVPIAERKTIDLVDTLYGKRYASKAYLKGVAPLYSVKTKEGAEVSVTEQHRFLTPRGWFPLIQLEVGDLILSDGTWHDEIGKEIKPNFLDRYSLDFHLSDELYSLSELVVQDILRQLHKIDDENSALFYPFHPSIEGSLIRLLYRSFLEYSISSSSYGSLLLQFQDFFQFHLFPHQNYNVELSHLYSMELSLDEFVLFPVGQLSLSHSFSQYVVSHFEIHQVLSIQRLRDQLLKFVELLYRDLSLEVCHFSSSLPPINNYNSFFDEIQDIKFDKVGEFYDISVPDVEHYSAQGIYHHNSGKSCCGAQKSLQKIMQGFSGAVLNPTFENFKDSTWPEFRNWIPWDYVVPKHRYRAELSWEPQKPFKIVFENGAVVICKGLHDPDSARGPNINWLWFDEGQDDETGDAWNIATASVRVGKSPQSWVTATGRGTYHWMYDFFVEQKFPESVWEELKKIQEQEGTEDIAFIEWFHGSIYDNSENLDPGFMASILATYPSGFKHDQEVLGLFADPGGNRGDASWFKDRVLNDPPMNTKNRVRYWDLAATEKKVAGKKITDPDETVGTKLSWWMEEKIDQYCVEHQISGTWEWETIKEKIINTAKDDGPFVPIYIEEEPGSGGINQVAQIKLDVAKELPGWTVRGHKPEGDKVVRADIWFADATLKKFWMVKGEWNDGFLKQLSSFPNARHDDKVDSVSGARVCCAPIRKWSRMKFIHLNMTAEELNEATNLPMDKEKEVDEISK